MKTIYGVSVSIGGSAQRDRVIAAGERSEPAEQIEKKFYRWQRATELLSSGRLTNPK
jgi:hypothetical protein